MIDQGFVPAGGHHAAPVEGGRGDSASRGPHRGRQLSSPALIGRERDLRVLSEAARAPPALILVEGEAGIGKSRLVREAASAFDAPGRHTLVGHCHRLREPFLLGSVVEALRGVGEGEPSRPLSPVAGVLQPLLPELAHLLPAQPAPVGDARAERHRIFRGLRELIGALGPTMCVLEDLHWADEGTLEFLAFLSSEAPEDLALVLTYRSDDLSGSSTLLGLESALPEGMPTTTVELSPLGVEEVRTLIRAILDSDEVSGEFASYLHEQTGGIPFAVEEVVRLLRDRDQLRLAEPGTPSDLHRVGVPPAVRQAIRERMEPFTGDARRITQAAAVLGLPAREDLLARVAGLAPIRAARGLTRALSSALLEEKVEASCGFRHALAAQAVYDEIPAPERRRLHRRAAEALESGSEPRPLALLAHHFKEADRPAQWTQYAEAAAEAASGVGDHRAAAKLLEHALSAPRLSRAARIRIAVKLSSAAIYSDCPKSVIGLLQRICDEEPMATGERGELRYWICRLRCQTGDPGPWRAQMERAVGELGHRPDLAARAMVTLAWPVYGEEHLDHHLAWLERAVAAGAQIDDPAVKTAVLSQRASILLCVGDPQGWSALDAIPPEGNSVEDKLQLLRAYHSLSVMALGLGHYARAESFLGQMARLDDQLEQVSWDRWRASTQASLDWRVGRWEGLEARARALSEHTAGRAGVSIGNEMILTSLLLSKGRIDEAERGWASILERAQASHWMSSQVTASAWLARARLAHGDAARAREVAALGLEVVRRKGIWIWGREVAPVAVQALLACEERTQARELADELARGLHGRDAPAAHAASYFCHGAVAEAEGHHRAATRLFERADKAWSELPSPHEAAQARERRACCLLTLDDDQGAELLLTSLETFEHLEASWDAARVRAELRARGVGLGPRARGGRRAYGDELSPREAEVAHLAGMGHKNREIAELLFISPRTVEDHVAAALRKLGLESRRALAAVEETVERG